MTLVVEYSKITWQLIKPTEFSGKGVVLCLLSKD